MKILQSAKRASRSFASSEVLDNLTDKKADFRNKLLAKITMQEYIARIEDTRARVMAWLRFQDWTYKDIGHVFGVAGSRVEQIVALETKRFKEFEKSGSIELTCQKKKRKKVAARRRNKRV